MKNDVIYDIRLKVKEEKLEELKELAKETVASAKNEAETLQYYWTINENICHIHEHYLSSEAVLLHLKTFVEKFQARFGGLGEVISCDVFGTPNEEVQKVLSGFSPKYYEIIDGFRK